MIVWFSSLGTMNTKINIMAVKSTRSSLDILPSDEKGLSPYVMLAFTFITIISVLLY